MGSWNATCALSGLPIEPGESVVQLILNKNPFDTGVSLGYYSSDFWYPRTLPLFGTYDDYGKVALGTSESSYVKQILAVFKIDGMGFEANTWDELEEAFHEGKVMIDKNHLSTKGHHSRVSHYLKHFEEFTSQYGKDHEEGTDPEIVARNDKRQEMAQTIQTVPPAPEVTSSPCISIMIRQDVWDSLCEMELESWYGTHTLKTYQDDAAKLIQDVNTLLKSLTNGMKPANFVSAVYMVENQSFDRLGDKEKSNLIRTALTRTSFGSLTPPFQFGAEDLVDRVLKKSKSEKTSQKVLNRFAQLLFIARVLNFTRQAWYPTTGQGSQASSWKETYEYHIRCAEVALNRRLYDMEEKACEQEDMEGEELSEYDVAENEKTRKEKKFYADWAHRLSRPLKE